MLLERGLSAAKRLLVIFFCVERAMQSEQSASVAVYLSNPSIAHLPSSDTSGPCSALQLLVSGGSSEAWWDIKMSNDTTWRSRAWAEMLGQRTLQKREIPLRPRSQQG